ncbi:MAG: acetyl-CoA C-acetyltransferase [Bacteriovoracaceae bacterium]|nr:acetyl-CoA C-acetyltransferase [Bacteriovoracaceae bacterium]
MKTVYIYDAVRTPRGRGKKDGKLHTVRPVDLAGSVLEAIQQRNNLDTTLVNDVVLGCVTQVGEQGGCIAKSAALYANYADSVSGYTLNRFCGSGLEAINQGASSIMSGYFDMIVAGGVEALSRVPIGSDGGAWMIDPDVATKTHFVPQGISADLISTLAGYSRTDVDSFAVESQNKATQAWEENRFAKSIIPIRDQNGLMILEKDEHIRPGTTVESLSGLRPSFLEMGTKYGFDAVALQKYPEIMEIEHVHHAGNSSGIVDGSSVVLIGNEESGLKAGIKPRAKIRSFSMVSTEPTIMLTGPAPATNKALKAAGMEIGDIDLIEINEAFASVVLRFIEETGADLGKVNVNGGAIAMGHPLGATGAMLLGTVLDELERQNKSTGLITLCIGGGMGIATIIERV